MRRLTHAAAVMSVGGAALSVAPLSAQTVLASEGLGDHALLRNSYNDGTSGNFGIAFSSTALATTDPGATPNAPDHGPCADYPGSQFHHFDPTGATLSGAAGPVDVGGAANQIVSDNNPVGSKTSRGAAVPQPISIVLLCTGLVGLLPMVRRQRS
jgi:hypothetical protein